MTRKYFLTVGYVFLIPSVIGTACLFVYHLLSFGDSAVVVKFNPNVLFWIVIGTFVSWLYYILHFFIFIVAQHKWWLSYEKMNTIITNYEKAVIDTNRASTIYTNKLIELETIKHNIELKENKHDDGRDN